MWGSSQLSQSSQTNIFASKERRQTSYGFEKVLPDGGLLIARFVDGQLPDRVMMVLMLNSWRIRNYSWNKGMMDTRDGNCSVKMLFSPEIYFTGEGLFSALASYDL